MHFDHAVFSHPPEPGPLARFDTRWPGLRRRAGGIALALALEAGLLMLLLTLGQGITGTRVPNEALTTVDFAREAPAPETPEKPQDERAAPTALPRTQPSPQPDRPTPPLPIPPVQPPAAVLSPRIDPAPAPEAPRIKAVIRDDDSGPAGPAYRASAGDSQRVGSGPNGEPVYAARWHREPYPDELRGYLSTATSPGYALINCRTVPDFKVDSCVLVDEYPGNAGLGRAVLAAAWQFKVRPPQVGGRVMVGEWVRIRISYDLKRG
jgi:periplasmic protein TonB